MYAYTLDHVYVYVYVYVYACVHVYLEGRAHVLRPHRGA